MELKHVRPAITGLTLPKSSSITVQRFDTMISLALRSGFRVDGQHLARNFLTDNNLSRMERLVFNGESLSVLKEKGLRRLEFIIDGPLPPELLRESPLKSEAVFRQVVGYDNCKACRLCIQVCPKGVYRDDGFGRPDKDNRRDEACTGDAQCGKCIEICPDKTISVTLANPAFGASAFIMLENPFGQALAAAEFGQNDLIVSNPLETGRKLQLTGKLDPNDLSACNLVLDESNFHPIFEINGTERHFVNSQNPENDLTVWAKENSLDPEHVINSIRLLYLCLPSLNQLKEGKYSLSTLSNRIIDDIITTDVDLKSSGGLELLRNIINDSYIKEAFFGAKRRAIGGILPPGTSVAFKTPYGEKVPNYVHPEKCVGPECVLCITSCPEGSGGETSAIKMVPLVPLGTISSLTRGLKVFVIKLDGSHETTKEIEDLTGQKPFEFVVNTDYCKACGTCITCCPHGVIEQADRVTNLREIL